MNRLGLQVSRIGVMYELLGASGRVKDDPANDEDVESSSNNREERVRPGNPRGPGRSLPPRAGCAYEAMEHVLREATVDHDIPPPTVPEPCTLVVLGLSHAGIGLHGRTPRRGPPHDRPSRGSSSIADSPSVILTRTNSPSHGAGFQPGAQADSRSCLAVHRRVHKPQLLDGRGREDERVGIRHAHAPVEVIQHVGQGKPVLDQHVEGRETRTPRHRRG